MSDKQVSKEHYAFNSYVNIKRWCSYYYQISEVINTGCKSLLIIGGGDNIVGNIISQCDENIDIHIFDFDDELNPTYIGDVREIEKIVKRKFDCVLCCQVLEHIPYECFENVVQQISHITKDKLIISLPLQFFKAQLQVKIPKIPEINLSVVGENRWKKSFSFNGEHYWEVGIKDKQRKDIRRIYQKYFNIERDYVVPQNPYHWFSVLKVKN